MNREHRPGVMAWFPTPPHVALGKSPSHPEPALTGWQRQWPFEIVQKY